MRNKGGVTLNMIPILLVTHGPFAPNLIKTSEMLVGKSEKLEAITLEANDNVKLFQDKKLINIQLQ